MNKQQQLRALKEIREKRFREREELTEGHFTKTIASIDKQIADLEKEITPVVTK